MDTLPKLEYATGDPFDPNAERGGHAGANPIGSEEWWRFVELQAEAELGGPTHGSMGPFDALSRIVVPPRGSSDLSDPGCYTAVAHNVTTRYQIRPIGWPKHWPVALNIKRMVDLARDVGARYGSQAWIPSVSFVVSGAPICPRVTTAVHRGGAVSQTGGRSISQSACAAVLFCGFLERKFGLRVRVTDFETVNIVAVVSLNETIDVYRLKAAVGARCEIRDRCLPLSEADQAATKSTNNAPGSGSDASIESTLPREPGANQPRITVFSSGKSVLMGARSNEELVEMVRELMDAVNKSKEQALVATNRGGAALVPRYEPESASKFMHNAADRLRSLETLLKGQTVHDIV